MAQVNGHQASLFETWYCNKHLQHPLSDEEKQYINRFFQSVHQAIKQQPQCPMHHDFHSRNLMPHKNTLFIIDFQDAILGPITYDFISLTQDYYFKLPTEHLNMLQNQFQSYLDQRYHYSQSQWEKWMDLTALQRHLKNLGTFARLAHRDQKTDYLNDMPEIINHIFRILERNPDLSKLESILQKRSP